MKEKHEYWYEALRDNPQEIIDWAEREIKEYQKLIKLIKSKMRKKGYK